ncbi:hypothetical protein L1987_11188 [Smallanthus sonchifolius]|uniref:Uncharacterized protein n=1 Tax=Smallanthus sonchifolius TaxID=185202 RepID=A0ACB9JCH5_9ASTR|nr:hypothetical protein L1987_11188 [Smallanthus sonchifolius]
MLKFMELNMSDEFLGTVAPLVVYWLYSGFYVLFGSLDRYRLHSKRDEDEKNLVSKRTVVKGVLLQQAIQAVVAIILFTVTGSDEGAATDENQSLFDLGSFEQIILL